MFRWPLRKQTKPNCKLSRDSMDWAPARPLHPWNIPAPSSKRKTVTTWTSQRHGKADSVRRSSKRSFHDSRSQTSEEHAPLQGRVAACHQDRGLVPLTSQTSGFYHLDACAGSVLTPHDCTANALKRLGNRVWVGGGQCRCCGSFLDPQLEHAETCSNAEATRVHYACVRAVVCGIKLADQGAHCFAIQAN